MSARRRFSFVIRAKATASARPATLSIPSSAVLRGTRSIFRRRVQRKNALDTYAKTYPAHGEGCSGRSALLGNHHAFERLQALLFLLAVAFLQAHIDTDGVAWPEFGEVF